jgi:Asp/Glu/hydantoin racemase
VSTKACLPALEKILDKHDGFLVCCYSQHPLVPALRAELIKLGPAGDSKHVTGIFEASIAVCMQSVNVDHKFGIVSTGSQWKEILGDAVTELVGTTSSRYAGTETTGLNADELHSTPKAEVDRRMKEATKLLLRNGSKAICLGCAGMVCFDKSNDRLNTR